MRFSTIEWIINKKSPLEGKLKIIDQTKLPHRLKYIYCRDIQSVWRAIKDMNIRGAPALGVAAAFGLVLGMRYSQAKNYEIFREELRNKIDYLKSSRPTAVNLSWALERSYKRIEKNHSKPILVLKKLLLKEALNIMNEDKSLCRKLSKFGASLINNNDSVLTYCNAGALATAGEGTALGVIYYAHKQNKNIKVYAPETRPAFQGARLTCWELKKEGIKVILICDNMVAYFMKQGKIKKVFVGADRVASNGDVANKIGTYNLAILAHHHCIPFYVVAPLSSFDSSIPSGEFIPIEIRSSKEITNIKGKEIAPKGIKVENPAFDVTPHYLIKAFVTDKGIFHPSEIRRYL